MEREGRLVALSVPICYLPSILTSSTVSPPWVVGDFLSSTDIVMCMPPEPVSQHTQTYLPVVDSWMLLPGA